jgi:DNA invertase Pin-like site-specific DNA recombinase
MAPTRAIAYLRQSKGRTGETAEDSLSFDAQEASILRYCHDRDYAIVETVRDHDISGEKFIRPGITKLLELADQGAAEVVVVYKLNRFARDVLNQEMTIRELKARGVRLESATEQGIEKTLIRLVHGAMGQQANEDHRETLKNNLEARARRGLHHGLPPYGYVSERQGRTITMRIVPEQAEVVRRIFTMRSEGRSQNQIADALNADGVPNVRPNPWHHTTIRKMLNNPTYAGYAVLRGEIIGDLDPAHMPAIVDRPLWQSVQRSFTYGERIPRHKAKSSWLEGLVRHGCGSKMVLVWQHSANAPAFQCSRAYIERAMRCQDRPNSVMYSKLEAAVTLCLTTDLDHRFRDPDAALRGYTERMGQPKAVDERALLEKRRADTLKAMKAAEELQGIGMRTIAWLKERDAELNGRLQEIDARLAAFTEIPTVKDLSPLIRTLDGVADAWDKYPPHLKRAILASLGVVTYRGGLVSIAYHPQYLWALEMEPTVVSVRYSPATNGWSIAPTTIE